jgi:hypothetical protein
MGRRSKTLPNAGLTAQTSEDLERIVIRLLEVAGRCEDTKIKHDLMKLADDLARIIEE